MGERLSQNIEEKLLMMNLEILHEAMESLNFTCCGGNSVVLNLLNLRVFGHNLLLFRFLANGRIFNVDDITCYKFPRNKVSSLIRVAKSY